MEYIDVLRGQEQDWEVCRGEDGFNNRTMNMRREEKKGSE